MMRRAADINIADLWLAAKKRLPRAVFDYIDGAAGADARDGWPAAPRPYA